MEKTNKIIMFLVVALLITGFFWYGSNVLKERTSEAVSPDEISSRVVKYIDDNFIQGAASINVVGVFEKGGLYKIILSIDGNEFDSYATKDGSLFFPEGFDLTEDIFFPELPEEIPTIETPENIGGFIACLKDKNFVMYGADWCPYCQELVALFGGYETAHPIYVECTEEQELCEEKNIAAYPTILIDGAEYKEERTLSAFSLKTGCEL